MAHNFFGYWIGDLPAVCELHFCSFLHHHPGETYELWLDDDQASSVSVASLQWILSHPAIRVRRFSLNHLIEKYIVTRPVTACEKAAGLKKLGRKLHCTLLPNWGLQKVWRNPKMGLRYKHSSWLFRGFMSNKVYRGDLARCLIPLEHYVGPSLYTDLDICFMSNLTSLCGQQGFAYRWEDFDFANTAILSLPGPELVKRIVEIGKKRECFDPWILFTEATCTELGIRLHDTRDFDPLWDPRSMLHGSSSHFFEPRSSPAADLAALEAERHLAIHWHNNWHTVPAPDSLYCGLLRKCQAASKNA